MVDKSRNYYVYRTLSKEESAIFTATKKKATRGPGKKRIAHEIAMRNIAIAREKGKTVQIDISTGRVIKDTIYDKQLEKEAIKEQENIALFFSNIEEK